MQEETTQKTIALVMRSSRLTADVLRRAIKILAEFREILAKGKNRERAREHQKDKGLSL